MLRWMSEITKLVRLGNERMEGQRRCEKYTRKYSKVRLKWYGHAFGRDEECAEKRVHGGDGGAGKKKKKKTDAEVIGQHQERLVGERIVRGDAQRALHKKHRPHIKVGKFAAEEEVIPVSDNVIILLATILVQ